VENAYEFVAKQVTLWYIYPSFVDDNSGNDLPFINRVLL